MSVFEPFYAYTYGTSFWYFTRATARLVDPVRVSEWFRPPSQPAIPNDLELYNIRTDGWGLLTIALMMLLVADVVPFVKVGTTAPIAVKKEYWSAMIWASIFHHVTTATGAYDHWRRESHNTVAMAIGVWVNLFLTVAGLVALVSLRGKGAAGKKRN